MRHRIAKRTAISIIVALALLNTACPKPSQSALDKAAKASDTVATRYVETVDFVTSLYTGGALKLEIKDKIADGLETFGKSGKKFNDLLKSYSAQYADGKVPANIWSTISQNFDELSTEFLKVIQFLPQAAGLGDTKAFRAISAAIVALAQVLSEHSVIPEMKLRQLEREVARLWTGVN